MTSALVLLAALTIFSSSVTLAALGDHRDFIQSGTFFANLLALFGGLAALAFVAWRFA